MTRRARFGQVGAALMGAGALAIMLSVYYQPIVDACAICEQYYPAWLCVLLGCW